LNFINLSIDHLRSEYKIEDTAKREEFDGITSNIKTEIQRLNNMISNFLDYGRPIKLKLEKVFVEDILREVINLADHKVHEQQIKLKMSFLENIPAINLDRQQIKASLMNILLNAVQAMPNGGELSIGTALADGCVVIQVADSGDGIAEDDLQKIFEPYFTTKVAGIGLGLAITKRVIEEHNGRIEVKSRPGQGTVVSLELPAA
ncbi:MAG: two-component sensor histidine kinase, partial [Deltaproteobacteria bacterium]|nr:two-component sensor histidine kinase [Deltaproteobacteria bacterium]